MYYIEVQNLKTGHVDTVKTATGQTAFYSSAIVAADVAREMENESIHCFYNAIKAK
jgi:hypothetical protein